MSEFLTVEQVLAAPDIKEEVFFVEAWNGNLRLRALNKGQQHRIRQRSMGRDGQIDQNKVEMLMFIEGVVEPKFSEEHAGALRNKSAGAFDSVLVKIGELSGVTAAAEIPAAEVDDAEGQFRL